MVFSLRFLEALIGLAPLVLIDEILQRRAAHRAEAAHRVADRQDRVGLHAGRQAENRVALLAEAGMPRRERRAEAACAGAARGGGPVPRRVCPARGGRARGGGAARGPPRVGGGGGSIPAPRDNG